MIVDIRKRRTGGTAETMLYGQSGHYIDPRSWTKPRRQCYTRTRRNQGRANRSEAGGGGVAVGWQQEVSSRVPAGEDLKQ